jgi:hypothetical protein
MRLFSHWSLSVAATLLAIGAFAVPSFADSESVSGCTNCKGYTFQATLNPAGGNNYSLSFTITNVSGAAANPLGWALNLFTPGSNISSATIVSGNNSGAYSTCSLGGATLCVKPSGIGSLPSLSQGQSLKFTLDFSCSGCSELANWIFLSAGTCTGKPTDLCYTVLALGSSASVPEPSTWTLYVFTLLALGLIVTWMNRTKRRWPRQDVVHLAPLCGR